MLFNSLTFILAFLPCTLLAFYLCGRLGGTRSAVASLVVASLAYYGWWNPVYLILILGSIAGNYAVGVALSRPSAVAWTRKALLAAGVAVNLGLLGYFKYAGFVAGHFDVVTLLGQPLDEVVLPLAISFFTFQQIAFLVDSHRGQVQDYGFRSYCLFVTFFPQLIAGPIVHHGEMMPQFRRPDLFRPGWDRFAVGLTAFFIGLFKKVAIADSLSGYANGGFDAAAAGSALSLLEAWGAALAYTFQIYFDFSGYSDMAIGLAFLFGIRLPLNFFSPYQATSIIDFWRRWHMTLSRFLRDYLYIPLGGNRKGQRRRYVNLMATMLLGGLWHGAGWTFVAWGALHGGYLVANHAWRGLGHAPARTPAARLVCGAATFVAVVFAWVLFRAESFAAATLVLRGMAGLGGVTLGAAAPHFGGAGQALLLAAAGLVAFAAPNTWQILRRQRPALASSVATPPTRFDWQWRPSLAAAGAAAALAFASLVLVWLERVDEFLYYQF